MAKQRELGLDPGHPPQRILAGHAADQVANLGFDLRSADFARSRLPSPEELEALAMPKHHIVGLHDKKGRSPIGPNSGEQRPEDPVTIPQPRTFLVFLQNRELLSEGEVLGGEFRSVAKGGPSGKHQDQNHAQFTASEKVNRGLVTVAGAWMSSIYNFFVEKAYGIVRMDSGGTVASFGRCLAPLLDSDSFLNPKNHFGTGTGHASQSLRRGWRRGRHTPVRHTECRDRPCTRGRSRSRPGSLGH